MPPRETARKKDDPTVELSSDEQEAQNATRIAREAEERQRAANEQYVEQTLQQYRANYSGWGGPADTQANSAQEKPSCWPKFNFWQRLKGCVGAGHKTQQNSQQGSRG